MSVLRAGAYDTASRIVYSHATRGRLDALKLSVATLEGIRELGEVPAGRLYGVLMAPPARLEYEQFEKLMESLERTRLVERRGDVVRWVGPALG